MSPKSTCLTKKQKAVLDFVINYIKDNGLSPTVREVAQKFGFSSPATAHEHLQNLKDKGFIKISPDEIRGLTPAKKVMNLARSLELPLAGLIAAGQPIEAVEERETMAVPADLVVDGANSYILQVKGESMIEDGILSGDYVIVERNPSPKNGDIIVALLDNTYATLKRFYRETNRIKLEPANSSMKPIYVKDLIVQGVVRAVVRRFQTI
ncbi:transcriptional repressor LexA [Patescibacteria group bacterium]|nr:transcriptional repressor LexA [Patescibacteria group bacterium]MBU1921914.1 transcriptional repressor LexA [Patescibacteria group bacterium]